MSTSRLRRPTTAELKGKGKIATLGMLIIDQFETGIDMDGIPNQVEEAVCGGGVYAMMGSRMFLPPEHIGLIVDKGEDFPASFVDLLRPLQGGIYWRDRPGGTTRALNVYSGGKIGEGHQSFRYLVPTRQINLSDLLLPPSPFALPPLSPNAESEISQIEEKGIKWVHVVVRNPRARAIVTERSGLRGLDEKRWEGKMIWEPLDVVGEGRLSLQEWCDLAINFDIISPNLLELRSILSCDPSTASYPAPSDPNPRGREPRFQAEKDIQNLYDHLCATSSRLGRDPPILICRAGAWGAYTISPGWTGWTPAFWREEEGGRVVDPTGGGNGFLGGVAAGMILYDGDVRLATMLGSAAASFMIQQTGLPTCMEANEDEGEKWNGDDVWERARVIEGRTANSGT